MLRKKALGRCWGRLTLTVAFLTSIAACGPSTVIGVEITGSIYTDLRVDLPCDAVRPTPDLAGVVLTFGGPAGALGEARTGPLQRSPLEPTQGTEAWTNHGCRFFSAYAIRLPTSPSYTVSFTAPPPADPRAGTFTGVSDLEPQTASFADLEARGFDWSFEALPSYVADRRGALPS